MQQSYSATNDNNQQCLAENESVESLVVSLHRISIQWVMSIFLQYIILLMSSIIESMQTSHLIPSFAPNPLQPDSQNQYGALPCYSVKSQPSSSRPPWRNISLTRYQSPAHTSFNSVVNHPWSTISMLEWTVSMINFVVQCFCWMAENLSIEFCSSTTPDI